MPTNQLPPGINDITTAVFACLKNAECILDSASLLADDIDIADTVRAQIEAAHHELLAAIALVHENHELLLAEEAEQAWEEGLDSAFDQVTDEDEPPGATTSTTP